MWVVISLNPHCVSVTPRLLLLSLLLRLLLLLLLSLVLLLLLSLLLMLLLLVPMKRMETQVRNPQLRIERKSVFLACGYCRLPTTIARSLLLSDIVVVADDDDDLRRHSSEYIMSFKQDISPLPSASATRTIDLTFERVASISFFSEGEKQHVCNSIIPRAIAAPLP